ncbi:glycoside hydrolase [Meredithblackwellia eburnea MCA 4105]
MVGSRHIPLQGLAALLTLAGLAVAIVPNARRDSKSWVARRSSSENTLEKRAPPKKVNTIVQLFEWNWDSIARECTQTLGPAGFGYAQVSPPSESILGTQWWTDYQPVSYNLTSKRGTRAQFASMVSACQAAGVDIIVDAVLNHMTLSTAVPGVGTAGNSYSAYNYPAVPYVESDFHSPCTVDFSNTESTYDCQLNGLVDLKTETDHVRTIEAAYLSDLQSLGVAGFRIDAAKSIPVADIQAIIGKLATKPYIVQEVFYNYGDPVQPYMYLPAGDVFEFRAVSALQSAFVGGAGLQGLLQWPGSGWVDSASAVVFVLNQDSERGTPAAVTYQSPNNAYILAHIFLLAQSYGSPTVYSGYNFTDANQGGPADASGRTLDVTCGTSGWRCEQEWRQITAMVAFHNAVVGTAQNNVYSASSNQISFGRGKVGHVAINYAGTPWVASLETSMPDGSYCDIIHDTDPSFTSCKSATSVLVKSGILTVTIPPYDAVAIVVGDGITSPQQSVAAASSGSLSSSAKVSSTVSLSTNAKPVSTGASKVTALGQTAVTSSFSSPPTVSVVAQSGLSTAHRNIVIGAGIGGVAFLIGLLAAIILCTSSFKRREKRAQHNKYQGLEEAKPHVAEEQH